MLQESKLNKLIVSLNKLNHHILVMHNVIDTYVDVLMDLDPNSLEFVTDSYHKESLKYGELQKEIISLISSVETTEKENTIRSIVEYCESLGCFANSYRSRTTASRNKRKCESNGSKAF